MNNQVNINQSFASPDPDARRRLLSNNLATAFAAGSPRQHLKTYDRPGMSRGSAQVNQAGIDSAREIAEGVASAYSRDDALAAADAAEGLRLQSDQEQFANRLGALQQQDAYSRQLASLTARQQAMDFSLGLLGGLLR